MEVTRDLKQYKLYKSGYGVIAKKVMRDKNISVEAKAIYAYMASFADENHQCYPSVNLMCDELGMSEKRFYKYRKQLVMAGYISIEIRMKQENDKNTNKRASNLYNLELNPIKLEVQEEPKVIEKDNQAPEVKEIEQKETQQNDLNLDDPTQNNNEVDETLNSIMSMCQDMNFKLAKQDVSMFIKGFGSEKVIQALSIINPTIVKNSPKAYMAAILKDLITSKTTQVNITKEAKKNNFTNYQQRERNEIDYEDITGWDNE